MANLKIPQSKSKGIGLAFLIGGIVWFILYWLILLEGVQGYVLDNYPTEKKWHFLATFFGAFCFSIIGGGLFAILTYAGGAFLKYWWQKWNLTYEEFDWHDIFAVREFWGWATVCVIAFGFFTFIWRGGL